MKQDGISTGILDEENTYDVEESILVSKARKKPKPLGIKRFEQKKSLWCWAAAVKMVADYETGDSPSQASIVKYIKGSVVNKKGSNSEQVEALKHIDSNAFEEADYWNVDTLSRFEKRVQNNHDKGNATILICTNANSGHSYVVEMSKGKYVEVVDPWFDKEDNVVYSKEELVNEGFRCDAVNGTVKVKSCVVY